MIDYIKILKIVLDKTDELINNNKFEPTEDPKLRKPILIHNILYYVGLTITVLPLFIMFIYWIETDDAMTNIIRNHTFEVFGITFNVVIMCCTTIIGIILLLTNSKIYNKTYKLICEMIQQNDKFIYDSKKEYRNNQN